MCFAQREQSLTCQKSGLCTYCYSISCLALKRTRARKEANSFCSSRGKEDRIPLRHCPSLWAIFALSLMRLVLFSLRNLVVVVGGKRDDSKSLCGRGVGSLGKLAHGANMENHLIGDFILLFNLTVASTYSESSSLFSDISMLCILFFSTSTSSYIFLYPSYWVRIVDERGRVQWLVC
jgi:hypothetical protein